MKSSRLLKIIISMTILSILIIISLNLFGIFRNEKSNNATESIITDGFLADSSCNATYHDINEVSKNYSANIDNSYIIKEMPRGNLMNELKISFYSKALEEKPDLKMSSFLQKNVWETSNFTKIDIESFINISLNAPKLPEGDYTIRKITCKNIDTNEILAYLIRYICFIDENKKTKSFDIIFTKDDFQLYSNDINVFYENGQLIMPTYRKENITDYDFKVGLIGYNLSYQGNGYRIFSQIDADISYIEETMPNCKFLTEQSDLMRSLIRTEY